MLRILTVSYQVQRDVAAVVDRLPDRDLAHQMRKAASSVTLNIAEGGGSRGRKRQYHYRIALGSAEETRAAMRSAEAIGYVPAIDDAVLNRMAHIIGVLVKVTR